MRSYQQPASPTTPASPNTPTAPVSPASPKSFFKKHSQFINKNNTQQEYFPGTVDHSEMGVKQIHRSQFTNENKIISHNRNDGFYDNHHQSFDIASSQKQKSQDSYHFNFDKLGFQQLNKSQLSSQKQGSQTQSHKKYGLSQCNFSQKSIRRVGSIKSHNDKYLYINSNKQRRNNKGIQFISDIQILQQEINKYESSIDKLKKENIQLRSEKVKLSSSNEHLLLIELRLEFQRMKKRIKQLESQNQLKQQLQDSEKLYVKKERKESQPCQKQNEEQNLSKDYTMATSCITAPIILQNKGVKMNSLSRNRPTQILKFKMKGDLNTPQNKNQGQDKDSFQTLQSIKSPYFLKKN